MNVMLQLGPYQFGLNTAAYQGLNRQTEYRWPSQDIFEGLPELQFTGPGADTITLEGVVFPEYWGGVGQIDALRALAEQGKPHQLVSGRGDVMGQWVIVSVSERQSTFAAAGTPLRQEFTLQLSRYNDRGDVGVSPGGGQAGPQIAAGNRAAAAAVVPAAQIVTATGALGTASLSRLAASLAAIDAIAGSVATPLAAVIQSVNQGMGLARSLQTTATVAGQTAKRLGNISSLADAQAVLGGIVLTTGSAAQAGSRVSGVIQDTLNAMTAAGEAVGSVATVRAAQIDVNRLAVGATRLRGQADDNLRSFQ
ncbi:phage tail protein [Hydrogenophaga intermedia]|uniref:phage tail protein n=1 Tax=Hydrogenophaga intermedia TaxID=65786 RepID=UPI002043C603|nr:phage tail protein [Hydrogenophaga intermedia]MCM3565192.1 phage tail protein [Hydrogenophaga intermedia]